MYLCLCLTLNAYFYAYFCKVFLGGPQKLGGRSPAVPLRFPALSAAKHRKLQYNTVVESTIVYTNVFTGIFFTFGIFPNQFAAVIDAHI